MRTSDTVDPFGTESIRARVLDTWRANPARFREDANAEQDFALGGYRDRAVVELLQNASDAATSGGRPGQVAIQLTEAELLVSNTGAHLTTEGVASLASLRASAKREPSGTVGHFGVGFAAVLAVSNEPVVASTSGVIRFSKTATRALVIDEASLADELTRRADELPILRLPFVADASPADGFTTTVTLPLVPGAYQDVQQMLEQIDALTLLALPGIGTLSITIDDRSRVLSLTRDGSDVKVVEGETTTRWHVRDAVVGLPTALASKLPVEERARSHYRITWALPIDVNVHAPELVSPRRVHAPTITDEQLDLPATLIADLPLDPSRRRVRSGDVTLHLLRKAASEYADLVAERAASEGRTALALIPEPGFHGEVDALLRAEIRDELVRRPLLRSATNPERLLTGSEATVVRSTNNELVMRLATAIPDVVDSRWSAARQALQLLAPRELTVADALDLLIDARESPEWWLELYSALEGEDPATLAGLPILLTDGSLTRDIRGAVDLSGETSLLATESANSLESLGLKVIHTGVAHPLLFRLGASSGDPEQLFSHPAVLARVKHADDDDEMLEVAGAALSLIDLLPVQSQSQAPMLSGLKLPCLDGYFRDASECVVPDSPLAKLLAEDDAVIDVARLGDVRSESLEMVGALTSLTVRRHFEVPFEPDVIAAVFADGDQWVRDGMDLLSDEAPHDSALGGIVAEVQVVAGLDLVADHLWAETKAVLNDPDVRRAIVTRTEVLIGGRRHFLPSPAAWWLREAPVFSPMTPTEVRLDGDDRLAGLLPEVAPAGLANDVLAAIGVRVRLEDWLAEFDGPGEVLDKLAQPDTHVDASSLVSIYVALAQVEEKNWPDPPTKLRVPRGSGTVLMEASDVIVVGCPHHRPLYEESALFGPAELAEILEVKSSAQQLAGVQIDTTDTAARAVPEEVRDLVPDAPTTYFEHDRLVVDGVEVPWWVDEAGAVHASTTDGLARGLAWSAGQWQRRWELAALLAEPELAPMARDERHFD